MWNQNKIAVVIPAFNEASHIEETINTLPRWVDFIIPVEDKSTDDTLIKIREIAQKNTAIHLVENKINLGNGGSIKAGFRKALELKAQIICVMDGDGQMDPLQLERLVNPVTLGIADFAKGNRFYSFKSANGMPIIRLIGNLGLTVVSKFATGYWHIRDPQNGFVASNAELIKKIPLQKLADRYNFQNDFLCWASLFEARVIDVPMPARYRDESSTLKILPTSLAILKTLAVGYLRRIFKKF